MTSSTLAPSAYPPKIAELMPRAIELTRDLGALPSQTRLTKTFHIGKDKARVILAELEDLAAKDEQLADLHTALVLRGGLADAPVPVPDRPVAEAPVAEPRPDPAPEPGAAPVVEPSSAVSAIVTSAAEVSTPPVAVVTRRRLVTWPVFPLCLGAFVAIWGGWVEMGRLTGFGMVTLLPGISDFQIDSSITLPIGVETYAAYALYVWLSGMVTGSALRFAKYSAIASLVLGALGQVAYHLMAAAGWTAAPWWITAVVACIPVAVLGMGAALAHLMHQPEH